MADLVRFPRWSGDKPDDHHLSMVHDDYWERFTGFRQERLDVYGVYTTVSRAWASYDDQLYYWNLYLSGRGNPAARPGTSNHESRPPDGMGYALDIAPGWTHTSAPDKALAAKWGCHFPLGTVVVSPFEDWHLEPLYARGYYTPPIPEGSAPAAPTAPPEDDMRTGVITRPTDGVQFQAIIRKNGSFEYRFTDPIQAPQIWDNDWVSIVGNGGPTIPFGFDTLVPFIFDSRFHIEVRGDDQAGIVAEALTDPRQTLPFKIDPTLYGSKL